MAVASSPSASVWSHSLKTNSFMKQIAFLIISLLLPLATNAEESFADWESSGNLAILTTADGANLPAGVVVEGFPVLVRIDKDWFDFAQANAKCRQPHHN